MDNVSSLRWFLGTICLYISCSLASSAGLGGGGLNVIKVIKLFTKYLK
jgi:hypothetical protein